MMMQSWMGSDFTNDDLVKQSSLREDYISSILGDSTIRGYDCWKINLQPKENAPVVWGKVELFISKADYLQILVRYFDEEDVLVNTMHLSEVKMMDGREIPTKMEMIPADEPAQKTVIIYQEMEFNIDLSPSFFSIQQMKRLR
jgi:hypothetical protein